MISRLMNVKVDLKVISLFFPGNMIIQSRADFL